jgi:hypothetical protein
LKYFEDAFWSCTPQAWCFQALQQIACEKCGLNHHPGTPGQQGMKAGAINNGPDRAFL